MSQLNGAFTAFLGLGLFLYGLASSNHVGTDRAKARLYFFVTFLGAAFFAVATYGIQFASPFRRPDMDGAIFFAWGLMGMMTLMTGVRALRLSLRPARARVVKR